MSLGTRDKVPQLNRIDNHIECKFKSTYLYIYSHMSCHLCPSLTCIHTRKFLPNLPNPTQVSALGTSGQVCTLAGEVEAAVRKRVIIGWSGQSFVGFLSSLVAGNEPREGVGQHSQ